MREKSQFGRVWTCPGVQCVAAGMAPPTPLTSRQAGSIADWRGRVWGNGGVHPVLTSRQVDRPPGPAPLWRHRHSSLLPSAPPCVSSFPVAPSIRSDGKGRKRGERDATLHTQPHTHTPTHTATHTRAGGWKSPRARAYTLRHTLRGARARAPAYTPRHTPRHTPYTPGSREKMTYLPEKSCNGPIDWLEFNPTPNRNALPGTLHTDTLTHSHTHTHTHTRARRHTNTQID